MSVGDKEQYMVVGLRRSLSDDLHLGSLFV